MSESGKKEEAEKKPKIEEAKKPNLDAVPNREPKEEPEKPPEKAEVEYVTLRQFAKAFAMSKTTVIKWINWGKVKAHRSFTGRYLIPKSEISKVAKEFEAQPAPEKPPNLTPRREKKEVEHGKEAGREEAGDTEDII